MNKKEKLPHGCESCVFYESEGIPKKDYFWEQCNKPQFKKYANLKSFPFKKQMPCFKLNFWYSEFAKLITGDERENDKVFEAFERKYR